MCCAAGQPREQQWGGGRHAEHQGDMGSSSGGAKGGSSVKVKVAATWGMWGRGTQALGGGAWEGHVAPNHLDVGPP